MERITLTAQVNDERYAHHHAIPIGDEIVRVRAALTRKEREGMALD